MPYFAALSIFLFSFITHAQTVTKVSETEAIVSIAGIETLAVGDKVSFLNENLDVAGQGEVTKVSGGGKKAIVKILSGQPKEGMSLEKISAPAKTTPSRANHASELDEEDRRILRIGEISQTAYVVGGIIGTYPIGFGVGHAIQGRYTDKGWIFTVGELSSLAVFAAGFGDCWDSATGTSRTCSSGALALGVVGFIGFRIWEIIDLWAAPPEINRRYRELMGNRRSQASLSPMIAPTRDGAVLGLRATF